MIYHARDGGFFMSKKVYIMENLGCANCAAKIEKKIIELPGVDEAVITFATRQLRLTAEDPDSYIEEIQAIARSFEPDITITERKRKSGGALKTQTASCGCGHEHHHHEECGCGHEHHHHEECGCGHEHHHHEECDCGHEHHHHKECGCGYEHHHKECGCGHDHSAQEKATFSSKFSNSWFGRHRELSVLLAGALLFVVGLFLPDDSLPSILVFILAYLILGWNVLKNAISGCRNGHVFDENFLMSIATIGAFLIQEYPEAVGVMLFFRIGEYFEEKAVENSRNSIMSAIDMRPETVQLCRGEEILVIPAEDAEPDQILLVRAGDRIPLDGTIVEGSTRIDTSAVTGEPVPVSVSVGDSILSGCLNVSGTIKLRVDKPLSESMVSRILECVENAAAGKPQMERFITRFSRVYTPCMVAAALFTAIVPSLITQNWSYWIYTALTFLVISCPCALVLSVPLAFFSGIGAGSSQGILFKNGLSLEALQKIKAIVMDKTGTITKGNFEVKEVVVLNQNYTNMELLSYFASCEMHSSHPIAVSILAYAKKEGIAPMAPDRVEECSGLGIRASLEGKSLLCGNKKMMLTSGIDCSLLADASYGTEVILAIDGVLAGVLRIEDTIKAESLQAIEQMHQMGLHTAMLTGDSEENALAVARQTGILEVHSRLLPEEKLTALQTIRQNSGSVLFVGDGINDAPVLAGADVGAAMGNGADAAIEAADVVFMNQDLTSVPKAIAISKASVRIAKQNVIFALLIKACVLILGFFNTANMWFAVFADSGVALICVLNSIRVLLQYRKKQ